MYEEERTNEYTPTVKVPAEIQNVKNPIMFDMTGRQLIFVAAAGLVCLITWLIFCRLLNLKATGTILLCFLFSSPLLAFGFIRPSDMNLEDWLTMWWSNNVSSSPLRKQRSVNAYEELLKRRINTAKKKTKVPAVKKDPAQKGLEAVSDLYAKGDSFVTKTQFFCFNDRLFKVFKLSSLNLPATEHLIDIFSRYFEIQIVTIDKVSYLIAGRKWCSDSIFSLNTGIELNEVSDYLFDEVTPVELDEWFRLINRHRIYDIKTQKSAKKHPEIIPLTVKPSKAFKTSAYGLSWGEMKVRTIMITGFSNAKADMLIKNLCTRFENVSTSVHLTRIWPQECLDLMENGSAGWDAYQKELMSGFLSACEKKGESIYNTCLFAAIEGNDDEIDRTLKGIKEICDDEGLELCRLYKEQYDGFITTLPLLKNAVSNNKVVTGSQLLYFMPVGRMFNGQKATVGA